MTGGGKLCMSVQEAAETTGICKDGIYDAVREGRLRAVKFGRRTLVRREDLEAFVRTLEPLHLGAR